MTGWLLLNKKITFKNLKKMKTTFFYAMISVLGIMFVGCVGTTSVCPSSSSVGLNKSNYEVLGDVNAEESSKYVLGIGGMKDKEGALTKLYKNANLNQGEAIINIDYVKQTKTYLGVIFKKVTYKATGQKIKFVDETQK
jgi:hypothetical protein